MFSALITFRVWIRKYRKEETPRGDLARDMYADWRFPTKNDYQTIQHYLDIERHATYNVLKVFNLAWRDYIEETMP